MYPITYCIGTFGPYLIVLFWKAIAPLGHNELVADTGHWDRPWGYICPNSSLSSLLPDLSRHKELLPKAFSSTDGAGKTLSLPHQDALCPGYWVTSNGCLLTRTTKITNTLPLTPELNTLTSWIRPHLGRMENLEIIENSVYSENENQEEGPKFDCDFATLYLESQRFASLLNMEKISVITKVINSGCKISRVKENKVIRADLARLFC